MIRRPPRSTQSRSSAASDVYKRQGVPVPVAELQLLAPVPRPGKIICIGLNYRDHAAETGKPIPTEPIMFAKFANSVVPDAASVAIPAVTDEVDLSLIHI